MKNTTQVYDLDKPVDRRGTDAAKYEEMKAKFGRCDLLPLWIADMDFPSPAPVTEALRRRLDHPVLGYTAPPESYWNSITSWLGRRHGWTVGREEITFVPGVKKGLGLCINYFTRPGDKILIQPPVYHSFRSVIEGSGRLVVSCPLRRGAAGGYSMDFGTLADAVRDARPAMMILCNPHNPIGIQWNAHELDRVARLCRDNGVILVSDEIYGDMMLDDVPHVPTASVSPEAAEVTVTLGAPTKTFNIEGIVSAWAVIQNPALREGFFSWMTASEFNEPPMPAIVATQSAYDLCEPWLDGVLGYLRGNVEYAVAYMAAHCPVLKPCRPQASFVMWIDFSALGLEQGALVSLLVNEARVALSDGVTFGEPGRGFMRLNLGVPRSVLDTALRRICDAANKHLSGIPVSGSAGRPLPFTKMQGLGNKFVLLDCRDEIPAAPGKLAAGICRENDCDAMLLLCSPSTDGADVKMRIFNADGTEAGMCGNGIRCLAKYVCDNGICPGSSLDVETLSGIKNVRVSANGPDKAADIVTVDMGLPSIVPDEVPVDSQDGRPVVDREIETPRGSALLTAISVGNPHGVVFRRTLDDKDVSVLGPWLENHPMWPQRANISFARVDGPHSIALRVWERGAGETMACGTGACATAAAAVLTGRAAWPVTVALLGGNLTVDKDPATGHILMTGPATKLFDGTYYPVSPSAENPA